MERIHKKLSSDIGGCYSPLVYRGLWGFRGFELAANYLFAGRKHLLTTNSPFSDRTYPCFGLTVDEYTIASSRSWRRNTRLNNWFGFPWSSSTDWWISHLFTTSDSKVSANASEADQHTLLIIPWKMMDRIGRRYPNGSANMNVFGWCRGKSFD